MFNWYVNIVKGMNFKNNGRFEICCVFVSLCLRIDRVEYWIYNDLRFGFSYFMGLLWVVVIRFFCCWLYGCFFVYCIYEVNFY